MYMVYIVTQKKSKKMDENQQNIQQFSENPTQIWQHRQKWAWVPTQHPYNDVTNF